jgi:two-component system nitrogen regulation sensor histidine kinase GlnL
MTKRDYETLWQALPNPALVLSADGAIQDANAVAEDFLGMSRRALMVRPLGRLIGEDSRLVGLVQRVAEANRPLSEYRVEFNWPETPTRLIDIYAAPVNAGDVLVSLYPRTSAERMDRAMTSRDAARSVVGMASMLAHEIKNPLAGISGAAQLLAMNLSAEDQELTTLIRDEADRIGKLVEQVDAFGDFGLVRRSAVNIHDVLDRAAASAKAGFASHVRFVEDYDPSLPPALSDSDQLMQVVLNLLKNAAEAVPAVGGMIAIKTAYRAGVKVMTARGRSESLPLQITVLDNGSGVPDDMRAHIFEPFVTSKVSGSGLGLALVSKIVADHGGVISCDSEPGMTVFRLLLPMANESEITETGPHGLDEDAA